MRRLALVGCHHEPARIAPRLKAGISKVRFGMTEEEVKAEIGEPLWKFPDNDDPTREWASYAEGGQWAWHSSSGSSILQTNLSAIVEYRSGQLALASLAVGILTTVCNCTERECGDHWADSCAVKLP